MLKLLSWNCCLPPWSTTRKHRLPSIVISIVNENPDIVCLQEVFFDSDAQYIIKKLSEKGFNYSYKFQNLLIVSKIQLINSIGLKFKSQGSIFSFSILDVLYGKAFQAVHFKVKDLKFTLINTHLLSAYALSSKGYLDTRNSQAKEIISFLKNMSNDGVIIVGDFNFEPTTKPYETIKKSEFQDLSKDIAITTTKKLDYIFGKNPPLIQSTVTSKFTNLSDHAYLCLEMVIRT